jgi:hypothetical protein
VKKNIERVLALVLEESLALLDQLFWSFGFLHLTN